MYDSLFVVSWTDPNAPLCLTIGTPSPCRLAHWQHGQPQCYIIAYIQWLIYITIAFVPFSTISQHPHPPQLSVVQSLMNNTYTKYFSQFNLLYLELISKVFRCFTVYSLCVILRTYMFDCAIDIRTPAVGSGEPENRKSKQETMQLISDMIFTTGKLKIGKQTSKMAPTQILHHRHSRIPSPCTHDGYGIVRWNKNRDGENLMRKKGWSCA